MTSRSTNTKILGIMAVLLSILHKILAENKEGILNLQEHVLSHRMELATIVLIPMVKIMVLVVVENG